MSRYGSLLACDPGGSTGMALHAEAPRLWQLGPGYHHRALWQDLNHHQPDVVVCEDFLYRQQANANLDACQYIGIIRLWCSENGAELHMQTPATGKAFWTDGKLKRIGVYQKGTPHARDALRHLLHYLTFGVGDNTYINRLKPPNDQQYNNED